MILVAKALQNPDKSSIDYEDIDLPRLRAILDSQLRVAYAWTFNPQRWARTELRRELELKKHVWLFLIGSKKWHSTKKMKAVDFYPDNYSSGNVQCPPDWRRYSPRDHIGGIFNNWKDTGQPKSIKFWLLVEEIRACNDDLGRYQGYFYGRTEPPYYCEYTENSFAFLNENRTS